MSEKKQIELTPAEERENTFAVVAHTIPFAIWLTLMVWLGDPTGWKYAARSLAGLGLLLAFRPWRWYPRLQLKNIPAGLAVGVLIFFVWIGLETPWMAETAPAVAEWYDRLFVDLTKPFKLRELYEIGNGVMAPYEVIAEGEQADISASGFSVLDGDTRWRFVNRSPSFWTNQISLVKEDGSTVPLPLPEDAEFEAVLNGLVIAKLNSALETTGGTEEPGALVAWSLQSVLDGSDPAPFAVFRPSDTQAIEEVAASETKLWVKVLDDVSGKLIELSPGQSGWTARDMELPANSTVQIAETSGTGDTAFVTVESMLTPPTLYAVPSEGEAVAIASEPAQFDASKFTVEQKFATSKDGTKVPYYLVRPKDAQGPLPTLIHAYGGFRAAQTPKYLTAEPYRSGPLGLFWVESGNAYVLANIRGGGEYGPRWHEDALREKRQNSFDDFHAVADDLVASRLTTPGHIAASGRSNGGVLVGAVANQRPDLYGAIISGSPLIDMRRYNKLLAGASWMAEYGNPDVPEDWAFMKEWSPYQNMSDGPDVPAAFYYLSTLDDRVHPGHARKAAAKHEAYGQTFYYHEYREGGHSVGSDHEEDAKRAALLLSYLNREIGKDAD